MRYQAIDPNLFISNRRRLAEALGPRKFVVLRATKGQVGSEPDHVPFRQNRDLFWATGLEDPWLALVLTSDTDTLFAGKASKLEQQWNGGRLTVEQLKLLTGIDEVRPLSQLASFIKGLNNIGDKAVDASTVLPSMRMVKDPAEVELVKHAIALTAAGSRRMLRALRPGVWEYELEAELTYEFTRQGGKHAFDPIIASGPATCVLHYIDNSRQCQDGELVVVDVGAEYANYASDISRTYPVSGRFSRRQRQVYEAVLRVQRTAIAMIKPGQSFKQYGQEVDERMAQELKGLGLAGEVRQYFPHSVSHLLGLDVHDSGDYIQPMRAGMLLTVEPGIYIPKEGIGVRLEDDILITDTGAEILSKAIPIEPNEVEALLIKR